MEYIPNCPSGSQRLDQTTILMINIEENKSFKLGPSTTFCNLAFKFMLIGKLIDKKLLMEYIPNCPSGSQRLDQTTILMINIEENKSFKLGPSTTFCNLAFKFMLIGKLIDKKLLVEYIPNCPSGSQRLDQTTILMINIEENKRFKLGPSTTFCNLAFKFMLIGKLIDKKLLMEYIPNCPSGSQRRDQTRILMIHIEENKSFKLGPSTTFCNLAFKFMLIGKLLDKKLLMKYIPNCPSGSQRRDQTRILMINIERTRASNWD
jgi:hypothetical protein